MQVSPDGRRLAWERRGKRDEPPQRITLLDTTTWETVATVDDDGRLIGFTPDGVALLYARGEHIRRYELAAGTSRDTGVPFDPLTWPGAVLLAGDRVAVEQLVNPRTPDETSTVALWDTATGQRLAVLADRVRRAWLAASADGRLVYAAGRVFDVATGREVWRHDDEVESVAFVGPRLLLARYGEGVRVHDTTTWAEIARLDTGQRVMGFDIHPSPDGTMAVLGGSGQFTLVDFAGGRGRTLVDRRADTARVLWSGDSRTLAVGRPGDYLRGRRNHDAYFTAVWRLPPAGR